jgi:hypothetical protein
MVSISPAHCQVADLTGRPGGVSRHLRIPVGLASQIALGRQLLVGLHRNATRDAKGGCDEPRGSCPARIESRIDAAICRCSGTRSLRWSTTSRAELVLDLSIGLDLINRTDPCQGRGVSLTYNSRAMILGAARHSRRQEGFR